ncbi:di-trans,poly-cis-decaprenylcistransferase [Candidatus Beckwithbacteria bacterium CG10_big_fil_rev_8_21_14_0_10_34_10]|uniref:Isoprenyl transferase n=1 Tax=Candidatus Beckwithbacteria bacterium CG10_big_fil_rev_8_21_14_0_10_34_10 TaxID=1974495 RepID=A0A2H0W995_9BACT|nr:MAG: di-trans,poly-cis-decaprenylcistransferase [Candidatus Beckwithbacteria bacterium CG10_big_fil_rev_8_21_14_0_10_34_10]
MNFPKHIAFIVDGNRRWARKKGLSDIAGHQYVADKIIEPLINHCLKLNIPYLTFWAFSTENWKRGEKFAQAIFMILRKGLKKSIEGYKKAGMRLKIIGDLDKLPSDLVSQIKTWVDESKENDKITVTFALNYGGRDEIIRGINKLLKEKKEKVSQDELEKYLDTFGLPDPDLIIRTGGDKRLSGFLLWQSEYSEIYFTKTLMPDFNPEKLDQALKNFQKRQRRFGK